MPSEFVKEYYNNFYNLTFFLQDTTYILLVEYLQFFFLYLDEVLAAGPPLSALHGSPTQGLVFF